VTASEDEAAVQQVLAGDTSAFEGLVRRWQGPLVNLAYRFCHDRGRAEEMAQEAFLRAYRSLAPRGRFLHVALCLGHQSLLFRTPLHPGSPRDPR
jgi:hypothetical protein